MTLCFEIDNLIAKGNLGSAIKTLTVAIGQFDEAKGESAELKEINLQLDKLSERVIELEKKIGELLQ